MLTLKSREGCHTGNAIIVREHIPTEPTIIEYLKGRKLWLVETDFGNRMKLTDKEIDEMYTRGNHVDYQHWINERSLVRLRNLEEDNQTSPGC